MTERLIDLPVYNELIPTQLISGEKEEPPTIA